MNQNKSFLWFPFSNEKYVENFVVEKFGGWCRFVGEFGLKNVVRREWRKQKILRNGKMVFAKLKNFFAKLIFFPPIFFFFPFSKIPKKFWREKNQLSKKIF
jgi:hypothetical protein